MRVRARTARIFRIDGAYLAAIPFSSMNARIDASMASKGQPLGEPGSIFCLRAVLILTVRFCLRRRLEIFASSVLIGITLLDPHVSYSAVAPQGFEYALPTSKRWFRAVRTLRNQPKHSILYLQPCRCNARV